MPTFMIFKNGAVINTIKGADPRGLTNAVEAAVKLSGTAVPSFPSAGRTLGGPPKAGTSMSRPYNFKGLIDGIIAFLGLYFISLFSLDGYAAAENSPFNIHRVAPAPGAAVRPGEKRTGATPQVGKKLGTIAGLAGGD